ncbi:hypothetical protein KFL_000910300 [Klebsormidium nitens]|uniref:Transmembrane protein n=1 Tax=Klebsormidium nitens TaxID=105231 RepID=A0A1Y1HXY0_KLENI|nr:hypothetical protein KFL_000910300 [Klebsormidium nitens]|eukprot:GAQ81811.1 hypothetical protein KFL_000910300 [Klebsormidium nitens]
MGPPSHGGSVSFRVFTLCLLVGSWLVERGAAQCIPTTVEAKVPGLAVPYLSTCLNGSYSLKFADGVSSHTVVVTIQSPTGQTVSITGNLNSQITTLTVGQPNGLASTCQGLGIYARSETAPLAGAAAALVLKRPSGGLLKQSALTGDGGRTAVATCLGSSNQYQLLLSGADAPLPGSIFVQAFLTPTVCTGLIFDTTPDIPISLVPGQASVVKPSFNPPPNPSASAVNLGPSGTFTGPGFTITRPIQTQNQTTSPNLPGEPTANTANPPTNPVIYQSTPGTFPPVVDPRTGLVTPGGPIPVGTNPGGNPSRVTGSSPNPVPEGSSGPQSVSDSKESRKWVAIVVPMLVICVLTSVVGGLVFFFGLRNVRRTVTEQMAELRNALIGRSRSGSPRDYRQFAVAANQGRVNGVSSRSENLTRGRERDPPQNFSGEYDDLRWGAADVANPELGRTRSGLSRNQSGFGPDHSGFGRDESGLRQNGSSLVPPRRGVRPPNQETAFQTDRETGQHRRLERNPSQLPGVAGAGHVADSRGLHGQGSARTVRLDPNGDGQVRTGESRGRLREGSAEMKRTLTFPAAEEGTSISKLFSWARTKPADAPERSTAPLLPKARDPLRVGHVYVPSQPSWGQRTKPRTSAGDTAAAAAAPSADVMGARAQENDLEAARHSLSDLEEGPLGEHHGGGLIGGAHLPPLGRERPTYANQGMERTSAALGGASGMVAGRGLFRPKSGVPLANQDTLGRANRREPERRDGRVSDAEMEEEPLGDLDEGRQGVVIRGLGPIEESGLRSAVLGPGKTPNRWEKRGVPDRRKSVDSQSLGSTVTKRVSDIGRHVGGEKGATLLDKDWAVAKQETGDGAPQTKGEGLLFETQRFRENEKAFGVGSRLEKEARDGENNLGQAEGVSGFAEATAATREGYRVDDVRNPGLERTSGLQSSAEERSGRRNSVALSGERFRGVVYASPDPVKAESFDKVREWFSRGDHGESNPGGAFTAAECFGAERNGAERTGLERDGTQREKMEAGTRIKEEESRSKRQVAFESGRSERRGHSDRREVRNGNGIGRYVQAERSPLASNQDYWEKESLLFGKRPPRWDASPSKAAHVAQVSEGRNETIARGPQPTRATFRDDKASEKVGAKSGESGRARPSDTWQTGKLTRGGGDVLRAREKLAEELEAGGWTPDRADVEMVDCLLFDLPEMVASVQHLRSQLE